MSIYNRFFSHYPLGMNLRNHLISRLNVPHALRLATNKTAFKRELIKNGILVPRTYHEIHDPTDLPLLQFLPDEFVVKPSSGMGGTGIILLERKGALFVNPSGETYSEQDLVRHVKRILDGDFSGYIEKDVAIIEERISSSPHIRFKNAIGLPDIRVFCYNEKPIMAMLRYPTFASEGRSNLHRGGIGMGIDIGSGTLNHIRVSGQREPIPQKSLGIPASFIVPKWEKIKSTARRASAISGLKISGVDVILDAADRVLVLEINGRPGIEIQNINELSLVEKMR